MFPAHLNVSIPEDLPRLLEDFTVAVLKAQPADLIEFAAEYFGELKDQRKGEGRKGVGFGDDDSDDYSEKGGGDFGGGRRKSVAAERYDPTEDDQFTIDSMYEDKSESDSNMLLEELGKIFLFAAIDLRMRKKVVKALKERPVKSGDCIIRQGEPGDFFYIIETGSFAVFVKKEEEMELDWDGERMATMDGEGSFGELALMYDQPRAATIRAVSDGKLWALDRSTFRRIVVHGAYQRRIMVNKTLSEIPMLAPLTEDDRNNLVDALIPRSYDDGEVIIREGDEETNSMFFIEEGKVSIRKKHPPDDEREINLLTTADYFGERALVTREPRQASAVAVGEVTVMELMVDAFERFLGPCMELMKKNMATYEEQVSNIFGGLDDDSLTMARISK